MYAWNLESERLEAESYLTDRRTDFTTTYMRVANLQFIIAQQPEIIQISTNEFQFRNSPNIPPPFPPSASWTGIAGKGWPHKITASFFAVTALLLPVLGRQGQNLNGPLK